MSLRPPAKLFLKAFVLLLLIAGLILAVFQIRNANGRLTDRGITLEEYRWHAGRGSFEIYNSKRDKLLATLLPVRIQKRFFPEIRSQNFHYGSDSRNGPWFTAFFYFEGDDPIPFIRLAIWDQAEERFKVLPDSNASRHHGNEEMGRYVKLSTANLPRREKVLRLKLIGYESDNREWKEIAEFKISNPAYGDYPVWEAGKLSTSTANGVLSGKLTRFTLGDGGMIRPGIYDEGWNVVSVALSESGRPTTDWTLMQFETIDATGNHLKIFYNHIDEFFLETGILPVRRKGEEFSIRFEGPLWPGEKAWKLRATFVRKSDSADSQTLEFLAKPEVVPPDR